MKIYFVGISGKGMGALAEMVLSMGDHVAGSDLAPDDSIKPLITAGAEIHIGPQDGQFLFQSHQKEPIDWLVYTSAIKPDHPELVLAEKLGIKISKRDELISHIIEQKDLKMVAIAGTHGKTTTTAMIVWACLNLGLPISYLVGSTMPFAPAGKYTIGSEFFIYEADEYDRNFLAFHPWLAVLTAVSYDHPDIYPTHEDYESAFRQFESQSLTVTSELDSDPHLNLAGEVRRNDATLAMHAVMKIAESLNRRLDYKDLRELMNTYPGATRRFEKLADGIYTDYAHHPEEVAATVEIALEEVERERKQGVVALYEPLTNTRQSEVFSGYKEAFMGVEKLIWLPTFHAREDTSKREILPEEFVASLLNRDVAETGELTDELFDRIMQYKNSGYLILMMSGGVADAWLREKLKSVIK